MYIGIDLGTSSVKVILIDTNQELLIGASDWRKDGCAIGY